MVVNARLGLLLLSDLDASVKAALFARVACWPGLFYDINQRVAVAVDPYLLDTLHVPGVLALSPESPSSPAEVMGKTCIHCPLKGLPVSIGKHQYSSGDCFLGHDGHQAFPLSEIDFLDSDEVQGLTTTPLAARCSFTCLTESSP